MPHLSLIIKPQTPKVPVQMNQEVDPLEHQVFY